MPFLCHWVKLPVFLRAVVVGLLIALPAANVWPLLVLNLGVPVAASAEAVFLALYIWWAAGGRPPRAAKASRITAFRRGTLSLTQWLWAIVAAICFAVSIHSSIVLLFRFVPFPMAQFRQGYDFSFIPTVPLRWLGVVFSAASAGICEETGFRGYMQRPIELRHGAPAAILISSFFFTGAASHEELGVGGDDSDHIRRRNLTRVARLVLRIADSLHDRPHHHGHRAICVLVDWDRRRVHLTAN